MPSHKKSAPPHPAHAPKKGRASSADQPVTGQAKPRNWSVRLLDLDYS